MNYQKIYDQICARGQTNRNLNEYTEDHHIIPKCIGGLDDKQNLTTLTFREHYIAHYLLTKIHKGTNSGIHYGFLCMMRNPHGHRIISSRMFETIKKNFSEFKSWHAKINNPGRSEKSKAKAKARMLSGENPMKKNPEKNPFLGKSYVAGRTWCNNGIENKYLKEGEQIPEGFEKGMVYKPRGKYKTK